jgi:tetratricopeptide (TPR) repeat protein
MAGLPILDNAAADKAALYRDRRDAAALTTAQQLVEAGRAADARAALAAVVAVAADEPTAVRGHACLLYAGASLMCGAPQDALAALAKIPARPAFALDEGYRKMIEACALRQLRRYGEALAAALASVEHGPTPGRLLVLADAQKHAGHVDDACRTLTNLVDRDPHNITALAQLAGCLHLRGGDGDADSAAACFARFAVLDDNGADAARNAAFVHAVRGDVDACVAALSRALATEPEATRGYIGDEVELERFRADPKFAALAPLLSSPL